MAYILRAYYGRNIRSIDLSSQSRVTIGGDSSDTLYIRDIGLSRGQITVSKSGDSFVLKGKRLYDQEGSPISSNTLAAGQRYSVATDPTLFLAVHPKQKYSDRSIGVLELRELRIGRGRKNDVVLANRRTSGEHCRIYRIGNSLRIEDLDSTNGTYLNGKQISDETLRDGDIINISIYQIQLKNNILSFYNVGDDMTMRLSSQKTPKRVKVKHHIKTGTVSAYDVVSVEEGSREDHNFENKSGGTVSAYDIKINFDINH